MVTYLWVALRLLKEAGHNRVTFSDAPLERPKAKVRIDEEREGDNYEPRGGAHLLARPFDEAVAHNLLQVKVV